MEKPTDRPQQGRRTPDCIHHGGRGGYRGRDSNYFSRETGQHHERSPSNGQSLLTHPHQHGTALPHDGHEMDIDNIIPAPVDNNGRAKRTASDIDNQSHKSKQKLAMTEPPSAATIEFHSNHPTDPDDPSNFWNESIFPSSDNEEMDNSFSDDAMSQSKQEGDFSDADVDNGTFSKMKPDELCHAFLTAHPQGNHSDIPHFLRDNNLHMSHQSVLIDLLDRNPIEWTTVPSKKSTKRIESSTDPSSDEDCPKPRESTVNHSTKDPRDSEQPTTNEGPPNHPTAPASHKFVIRETFPVPPKTNQPFNALEAAKALCQELFYHATANDASIQIGHLTDNSRFIHSMAQFPTESTTFAPHFKVQVQARQITIVFVVHSSLTFGRLKQGVFHFLQNNRIYLNVQSFEIRDIQQVCGVLVGPGAHPTF